MQAEGCGGLGCDGHVGPGGRAPDLRIFQPHFSVGTAAVTGGAEVDGHLVLGNLGAKSPVFQLGHVDECKRGLQLIGTATGAGVVRSIEDAVGGDEVGGATGAKATPVAGAAVVG